MAKQASVTATAKPNIFSRIRGFFEEVKVEMKKVAWPAKEEVRASTTIVMLMLILMAAIVGVYDYVFQVVVLAILKWS